MTSLWSARRAAVEESPERSIATVDDYAAAVSMMGYGLGGGLQTPLGLTGTYGEQKVEPVAAGLDGYAQLFGRSGVIYACMAVRLSVFSTVRFQWQRLNRGRPSEMYGTADLAPLERPWPGGTTQDLLARMIQDADLSGNSYQVRDGADLVRLRPDWVQIVLAPRMLRGQQIGWVKLGYVYWQDGVGNSEPAVFLPDEVAHWAPMPDPLATFRGMSWLTPVLRETQNDAAMEKHRSAFFEHAATPNLSVSMAKEVRPEAFRRFMELMESRHRGVDNAYKTLYLGGGADVKVIGQDFKQMDFTSQQGHAETRIAAAAGVPPVIVGLSEGLQAATYSNYGQARRRFADGTMHPLWQNAAGSLAPVIPLPARATNGDTRLWYDSRDVPFLREDRGDAARIQGDQAGTIRQLIEAGFDPASAVAAVDAEDWSLLVHTGLVSVQLQQPGTGQLSNATAGDQPVDAEGNTDA